MKSMLSAAALAVAILGASAPASAAIVVSFAPSSTHVNVGDSVTIDVSISGLDTEILSGADLNFLFSSTAATRTSSDFSSLVSALESGGAAGDADLVVDTNTPAQFGFTSISYLDDATLAAAQANNFLLGSFLMTGAFDGVTNLTLGASPDFARNFVGLNALSLNVSVGDACIAVGQGSCGGGNVPEPASFGLAAVALLAAGAAGRTRRCTGIRA